jgi:hypothetical protein
VAGLENDDKKTAAGNFFPAAGCIQFIAGMPELPESRLS